MPKQRKKHCKNDICKRAHYLYELIVLMSKKNIRCDELASIYSSHLLSMSKKCQIKIPSYVKFQICKNCHSYLHPAYSSQIRLRSRRQKHLVVTCCKCKKIKRFILKKNQFPWSKTDEEFQSK